MPGEFTKNPQGLTNDYGDMYKCPNVPALSSMAAGVPGNNNNWITDLKRKLDLSKRSSKAGMASKTPEDADKSLSSLSHCLGNDHKGSDVPGHGQLGTEAKIPARCKNFGLASSQKYAALDQDLSRPLEHSPRCLKSLMFSLERQGASATVGGGIGLGV